MGTKKQPDEIELQSSPELADSEGISLDELSASFARLLGSDEAPATEQLSPDTAADQTNDSGALFPADVDLSDEPDDFPASPRGIVEAILFVGHPEDQPISARNIASLMRGVRSEEVEQLVAELNADYVQHNCPYHIESVAGGFRMVLRNEFDSIRERFYGRIRQVQLTQAAINTLAIVAYNQPLEKQAIVEMSGDANVGRVLAQLVRRGLLSAERQQADQESGNGKQKRKQKKTKHASPMLYQTTDRFLDLFGLSTLSDLPKSQDLTDE